MSDMKGRLFYIGRTFCETNCYLHLKIGDVLYFANEIDR